MVVNVLAVIQADGSLVGSSQEFPELEAAGKDEKEFSRNLIQSFWSCLISRAGEGQDMSQELRLRVRHLGPDPAAASEMDWEVVMPRHVH